MEKIISRKKSRKYLFQKLFSDSYNKNDSKLFDDSFMIDSYKWNLDENYISEMFDLVKSKEDKLIEVLKMYAPKFSPEKMDLTYVLPIFIASTEMLYFSEEIPAKVSINEAIELSKTYWTDSAKKIVNWVLNWFYKDFNEAKIKLEKLELNNEFSFFEK